MAPMTTSSPPRTIDCRRGWYGVGLGPGSGTAAGTLGGGPSAMRQPYPRTCRCRCPGWSPPLRSDGRRGAEVVQHTLRAARRPGEANPTSVQDQAQAEPGPLFGRQHLRHLGLDLDRIAALGKTQAPRQSLDVRVDGKPGDAEGDAEHDIGGLATDARQGDEIFDPGWYLAAESLEKGGTGPDDGFGLHVEEPGRRDDRLDLPGIRMGERGRIWISGKQLRCHRVDGPIRRLGREDRRNQHLERVPVLEFGDRRVQRLESLRSQARAILRGHPYLWQLGHRSRLAVTAQ